YLPSHQPLSTVIYTLSLHDALPIFEVKDFMKRDEVALGTSLSGDSVVTRAEAARLRNENLNLHRQIDAGPAKPRPAADKSSSRQDRKSTRLNSSHVAISYAVFCLKK